MEWESCWYTPEEERELNLHQKKVLRRLEQGKSCRKGDSFRGLESRTTAQKRRKQERRELHITTVLEEEEMQKFYYGSIKWRNLAEISQVLSKESVTEALAYAKHDEEEAHRVYNCLGPEKKRPRSKIIPFNFSSLKKSQTAVKTTLFNQSINVEDEEEDSVTEATYLSDSEFEDKWDMAEKPDTVQASPLVEPVLFTKRLICLFAKTTVFILFGVDGL
eukprot:scaffold8259_cov143-Cylindrotheca_fusiformis.AAC.2